MSDCIEFKGHKRKQDGRAIMGRSRNGHRRIFLAHRWAWAEAHDKDPWLVPNWVQIKHSCGNHGCINPDHLFTTANEREIAALPSTLEGRALTDPRANITSRSALEHVRHTTCSEGHLFREAEDDTPCIPCQIQRKRDLQYGIDKLVKAIG